MKHPFLTDVPVLCLFFNRPDYFSRVFAQVRKARPRVLFLCQDGPRSDADLPGIERCRAIASEVDWQCEVHTYYQERNYGVDPFEYMCLKHAFSMVDRLVILEDDVVPSDSFLPFCREMLERYKHDERISMVSGINYLESMDMPYDYFFTTDVATWGWATWRRVADGWDGDYSFLADRYAVRCLDGMIKERGYRSDVMAAMRRHAASGKQHFETIHMAYHYLGSCLAVVPARNMITNIGAAGGVHYNAPLQTVCRADRKLLALERFDTSFPLRHPPYVIENIRYKHLSDRFLCRNTPVRWFFRKIENRIRLYCWMAAKALAGRGKRKVE